MRPPKSARVAAPTIPRTARPDAALTDVATALAERDQIDSTRAASPLAGAADAHHIETTGLSVDTVVDRVMAVIDRSEPTVAYLTVRDSVAAEPPPRVG